jgi:hypothetical protein
VVDNNSAISGEWAGAALLEEGLVGLQIVSYNTRKGLGWVGIQVACILRGYYRECH